jgi:AraC-like DNA-binding protein
LENIFNNGFATLKLSTRLEDVFTNRESSKSNCYSLLWVTEGMIDLSIDEIDIQLNENQMAFITPVKYVKILENHGKVNVIQFNREFYCIRENDHEVSCEGILYFGSQGLPTLNLEDKDVKSFERLLEVIREEFEITDTIQEEMLRIVLKKWLIKATRIAKVQNNIVGLSTSKTEVLRQFKVLVEKNYKTLHKVSDYAKLLNMSPKTISNQFNKLGQESPSVIIQQRVIIEAKRYILYSNLSNKEIAYKLGFDDSSSFSHYFKTRTGISSKQFKEINN